jgi:hypothetical protein
VYVLILRFGPDARSVDLPQLFFKKSLMKASVHSNLACRYCQYYAPEGRRGGECQRLGAHVQGEWAACSLMTPSLGSPWSTLEESSMLETLQTEHQSSIKV